jgi:protein-disulfide isomerase
MAESGEQRSRKAEESAKPSHPTASELALAVALAAAHALWSLFQWDQLILARRGGDFFCGLGKSESCATVWDLPIATAVQSGTGLPVAGWGLVWSVVAFALPLWALVRRARGRPLEPVWSATLLTVLGGVASVAVLGGASFVSREFCATCVITYALVLAYAAVCLCAADRLRPAQIQRGALLALSVTSVAFLVLLYPGLRTPRSAAGEREAFLEVAKAPVVEEVKPAEVTKAPVVEEVKPAEVAKAPVVEEVKPAEVAKAPVVAEVKPAEVAKAPVVAKAKPAEVAKAPVEAKVKPAEVAKAPVEAEVKFDAVRLDELIARLSPELRQGLSDALAVYARGDRVSLRPGRLVIGSSAAPVRITEFTDTLCGHCAQLHKSIEILQELLPSGSFALESRHFPLDAECNPAIQMRSSGDGVRCLAARAMICVEKNWLPFAGVLFKNQRRLTTKRIYSLAAPFISRERLEDCVTSAETEAKLRDDIAWALQHEIKGTPLLLVNGREAPASLEFLFAMVLAKANPEHPAFAVLPPPQPRARLR